MEEDGFVVVEEEQVFSSVVDFFSFPGVAVEIPLAGDQKPPQTCQ